MRLDSIQFQKYNRLDNHLNYKYKPFGEPLNMSGYEYAQTVIDPNFGYQKFIKISDSDTGEIISEDSKRRDGTGI